MHFIRQLFSGSGQDWVHGFFVKYGKGVFNGPVLRVKSDGRVVKVGGSPEYCSAVGLALVSGAKGMLGVSGGIYSRSDFRPALRKLGVEFEDDTKRGYFVAKIEAEVDAGVLKQVYEAVPDGFLLLSLKGGKPWSMKSGKKLPKPGGGLKEGFFSASMGVEALGFLAEDLLFDLKPGFREASVEHKYFIDSIVVPAEVKDAAEARLKAKRMGRVVRKVLVDGVEKSSECNILV